MKRTKKIKILAIVCLIVLGLAGCFRAEDSEAFVESRFANMANAGIESPLMDGEEPASSDTDTTAENPDRSTEGPVGESRDSSSAQTTKTSEIKSSAATAKSTTKSAAKLTTAKKAATTTTIKTTTASKKTTTTTKKSTTTTKKSTTTTKKTTTAASTTKSTTKATTAATTSATMPKSLLPSSIKVGYYSSWSAYSGFTPDKIQASMLDVIHYAFAAIGTDGKIKAGDTAIDYTNFTKFKALKAQYPHLITLISIGGWNDSDRFSDVALTDVSRKTFAQSVVSFIRQYGFDGVDLDWEYPVSGTGGRAVDKTNFTLLMKVLRETLDAQAKVDRRYYYLTFAGGAANWYLNNIELSKVSQYIDYALDMTYDLHGPWDTYADFNSPLYTPTESSPQYKISVDSSIRAWLSAGIPKGKLVLGIPFYGYVYNGVKNTNNGLYQTFTSAKAVGYDSIVSNYLNKSAYTKLTHSTAGVPYLFGNNTFISYDDAASVKKKAQYARSQGLRGTAAWELSYDRSAVLLKAMAG